MRLRTALPLLGLCLSACVPPRVRVAYPAAEDPSSVAAAKALSEVYALFPEEDADADLAAFAAAFDAGLRRRGGTLLAYRAAAPGPDPFLAELAPSAVLSVDLAWSPLARVEFEREVKSKDKDGVEKAVKKPFVRLSRRVSAVVAFKPSDGGGGSLERLEAERGEEKSAAEAKKVSDAAWMGRHGAELMRDLGAKAAASLPAPRAVTRDREIFVAEKDPASKAAADAAFAGSWEAASAAWAERLEEGGGGWRDLWNLAVAAEQRRAFAEAERLFKKARAAAADDPAAAKVPFEEAAADAARGQRLAPRSETAAAFFARPTVVLPFSDDTTSVDGPDNLRRMVHEALRRGGWSVAKLEDADAALRRKGYSQGGQLSRAAPGDLALWTGAERLVFGHVAQFRNVMLGFIGRREVEGTLSLWDAGAGAETHRAEAAAVNVEAGSDAAGRLAAQLGKALVETWMRKPLGPESAAWVLKALRGLPLRPPAKK